MSRSQRPVWLGEDRRGWDHVRIHVQLLDDPAIGVYELAAYAGIARHAEVASGHARPAVTTLAKYAGMGPTRTRTALAKLAELGYVEVVETSGKASTYVLLPPPPMATTPSRDEGVPSTTPPSDDGVPHHETVTTPPSDGDEQEPVNENQGTTPTEVGAEVITGEVVSVDKFAAAKAIVDPWWEERRDAGNPVGQPYIAVVKVVDSMLKNHVAENRLAFALRAAPTVSTGALEFAIQQEVKRREGADLPRTGAVAQARNAGMLDELAAFYERGGADVVDVEHHEDRRELGP